MKINHHLKIYRRGHPLQNFISVKKDPLSFLAKAISECGDFVFIKMIFSPFILVNDPELYREVLIEKPNIFIIKGGVSGGLARLIGSGILTNHGVKWKESRSLLQPLFQQTSIENYLPLITDRVSESLERWKKDFSGRTFEINREILALTFRIMSSTLFQYNSSFKEADDFANAVWILQLDGMNRHLSGGDYFSWLPNSINKKVNGAKQVLIELTQKMIVNGAKQPMDEILSLLFAGTESISNTMCWAMILLENHPEWLIKLKDLSKDSSVDKTQKDELFSQVLNETMRLYPAGWAFERVASQNTTLGGEFLKKGTRLLFSPYFLHRNPRFWVDPEKFNPNRFSNGSRNADGVQKFAYLPFGAGPRSCIGSRMAQAEMQIMLKMIVSNTEWNFDNSSKDQAIKALGSFKIRFSHPLALTMRFPVID